MSENHPNMAEENSDMNGNNSSLDEEDSESNEADSDMDEGESLDDGDSMDDGPDSSEDEDFHDYDSDAASFMEFLYEQELMDDEEDVNICCCIICGEEVSSIGGPDAEWQGEFRIIYSQCSGNFVTGVGGFVEPGYWMAPSDPELHWSDGDPSLIEWVAIPIMGTIPHHCRHGYILHNACWSLLQEFLRPTEIPITRLLHVCQSLPISRGHLEVLQWGHNYGGLWKLNNDDHYPWENRFKRGGEIQRLLADSEYDPEDILQISGLFNKRVKHPPFAFPMTPGNDYFSSLPWEILEMIVKPLSTADALNLRLVSKAFSPLLTSVPFWKSRFEPGGECSFVFERPDKDVRIDWTSLYKLTNSACNLPGLRNRKRIWPLIKQIVHLTSLKFQSHGEYLSGKEGVQRASVEVGGDASEDIDECTHAVPLVLKGCRFFENSFAYLPEDLSGIAFSVVTVADVDYLSGIRLMTEKGSSKCLGYVQEGHEILCEVSKLRGFVVAADSRGLNALRVVRTDGTLSEWIGRPGNSPTTTRLVHFDSPDKLCAEFDGFKIINLRIIARMRSSYHNTLLKKKTLRETALWYPQIPGQELYLNPQSFYDPCPTQKAAFDPMVWIHFGGPGGSYLREITGVVVHSLTEVESLEFQYNTFDGLLRERKLGRQTTFRNTKKERFRINGAGGELITTLEAGRIPFECTAHEKGKIDAALGSVKLTTNWGRIFYAGKAKCIPSHHLKTAPGTVLTGLYATQITGHGLTTLGAISEKIQKGVH